MGYYKYYKRTYYIEYTNCFGHTVTGKVVYSSNDDRPNWHRVACWGNYEKTHHIRGRGAAAKYCFTPSEWRARNKARNS